MTPTPKEKAKELVEKFKPHSKALSSGFLVSNEDVYLQSAKQCALICVEEKENDLLKYIGWSVFNPLITELLTKELKYWLEVKQEIENLKT